MKLDKTIRLSLFGLVAAFLIFVTGCYMMPGSGNGTAKVAIGVKGIPPNLTSVALVVTAPGMATISTTASVTAGSITVSVPAGPARTFTLLLNNPSATLEGVATVDLQPGETTTINVTPTLGATQIVVPDEFASRLDQISDMTGTGWTTLAPASSAYAVAFDSLGRLYVASGAGVYKMNDISGPFPTSAIATAQASPITAMAMDLTRGLLYFIDGVNLYSIQVTPSLGAQSLLSPLSSILAVPSSDGLAVDSEGFLYLTGFSLASGIASIVKVNPGTLAIAASLSSGLSNPWDVMVKDNYVYVSDYGAKKIVRLTTSLQPVDSFPGPTSDPFVGPKRFLAILNKPITVIDDSGSSTRRLASFNDMAGDGWTTYGSYASPPGVGQFQFYES